MTLRPPQSLTLLLGGARSGKSHYAETWGAAHGGRVLFVATAQAFDDEMHGRIAAHRAARPSTWDTLEAPRHAGEALEAATTSTRYDTVIVDCLTLLASNALLSLPDDATQADADTAILAEADALLTVHAASSYPYHMMIVTNEVGMGVVPPTRLGRFYRDALGRANQRIAQHADTVLLFVAGLAWPLKGTHP
jgi:adenosylcobinamide kinase/adenosylcobinamide-phosphate guanylyltransferase